VIDHEDGVTVSPDSTQKWTRDVTLSAKKKVTHNSYVFTFRFNDGFKMILEPG